MKTFTGCFNRRGQNFRLEFDCPNKGLYKLEAYGLEFIMEKNPDPIGYIDNWSVEVFWEIGQKRVSVALQTWQPTRANCLEWIADLAITLRRGETVWFDHSVKIEDGRKWAYRKFKHDFQKWGYVWNGAEAFQKALQAAS